MTWMAFVDNTQSIWIHRGTWQIFDRISICYDDCLTWCESVLVQHLGSSLSELDSTSETPAYNLFSSKFVPSCQQGSQVGQVAKIELKGPSRVLKCAKRTVAFKGIHAGNNSCKREISRDLVSTIRGSMWRHQNTFSVVSFNHTVAKHVFLSSVTHFNHLFGRCAISIIIRK